MSFISVFLHKFASSPESRATALDIVTLRQTERGDATPELAKRFDWRSRNMYTHLASKSETRSNAGICIFCKIQRWLKLSFL